MKPIELDYSVDSKVFGKKMFGNMDGKFGGHKTSLLVLGVLALGLSGCIGGTTFGTGVSQEQQLLEDLEGMMSMGSKKRKRKIDYSARPDLVLPAKTAALPAPLETESSTSNVDWPESPEQRIARIRGEAEEADPRSGEISVEELKRKKVGIRIATGVDNNPEMDKDGHAAIYALRDGTYKKTKMLKEKYSYSTGVKRKYLTEPPVDYRVPIATAPVGDLGISEAEKERRAEKLAKAKKQSDTGMWTD